MKPAAALAIKGEGEYHKPPIYNFELHTTLVNHSDYPIIYDYYIGVFNKLEPVQGKKYELSFSNEDFYIYNVVHAYKHYMSDGTGLRILTDILSHTIYPVYGYILQNNGKIFVKFCGLKSWECFYILFKRLSNIQYRLL